MLKEDTAKCPNCGEIIEVDIFSEKGDVITCDVCDAELEIAGKHPLSFKVLSSPDVYEEYGDEDYYEGDDN
jgi:lysine biosynthesis protein LysW